MFWLHFQRILTCSKYFIILRASNHITRITFVFQKLWHIWMTPCPVLSNSVHETITRMTYQGIAECCLAIARSHVHLWSRICLILATWTKNETSLRKCQVNRNHFNHKMVLYRPFYTILFLTSVWVHDKKHFIFLDKVGPSFLIIVLFFLFSFSFHILN